MAYGVVPPREPIGTVNGSPVLISREWWRFFSGIFLTTGSGQIGGSGDNNSSLIDDLTLTYLNGGSTGPDLVLAIADIAMLVAINGQQTGRIAALERRVSDLQTIVATIPTRSSSNSAGGSGSVAIGQAITANGTTINTTASIIFIRVTATGPSTQDLPSAPSQYEFHEILFMKGDEATNPVTISGNGNSIEINGTLSSSFVCDFPYSSRTFTFIGSAWFMS